MPAMSSIATDQTAPMLSTSSRFSRETGPWMRNVRSVGDMGNGTPRSIWSASGVSEQSAIIAEDQRAIGTPFVG